MRGRRPNYAWTDISRADQRARLMRKVRKRSDGCWEWIGKRFKNGYGQICIHETPRKKRYHLVHRLMWTLHHGKSPGTRMVLHSCDQPWCVRPSHLFVGTARDNAQDMIRKNRQRWTYGEKSPRAQLTEREVQKIRAEAAAGQRQRDLAARFGVSRKQISMIVNRKQWKHLP